MERVQLELAPAPAWMRGMLASTLVFNLIDAVMTLLVVMLGLAIEANPLMAELLDGSPQLFVIGKIALVTGGVAVLWLNRTSKLAKVGASVTFSAYAAVMLVHLQSVHELARFFTS